MGHDVWQILCAWGQPQEICRLGLFHSAYSNAFVSMGIYDGTTPEGRAELSSLIGEKAEELVYRFCIIPREQFENDVLAAAKIPDEGCTYEHIRTGDPIKYSAQ